MNPGTMPASNDLQDLCSLAMDQALGIEKASLSTVVHLNSCVVDIYGDAFTPALGYLFDMAAYAFAFCMELQINWLTLMAPQALSHVAAAGSTGTSSFGSQVQPPTAEVWADSMDIAIGEGFTAPKGTVASDTGRQAQPTAGVPESKMEIAMGARAGG